MSASAVIERSLTHEQQVEATAHARRAQLANQMSTMLAAAAVVFELVFGIVWVFSREFTQLLAFDGIMLGMLIGSLLYKYLASQQRVVAGFVLFEVGFALTVFGAPFVLPGLLPAASLAYLLIILYAFLLLGDTVGRGVLAGSILAILMNMLFAESVAEVLFQPLDATVERVVVLFTAGFATLVGGLMIRSVVLNQDNHFRQAQLANLEIEERVQSEQAQREQLEQANQEIETRAASEQAQREQLQHLITQVRSLIGNLNAASAEIQAATTQQMASATEQDTAVTQTVATVEEVRATVQQTAERAQAVADAAQQSVDVSRQGEDAVNDTVEGMAQIRDRAETIAETILALSGRTQQIGEIIETVNALADQSKLLALNASIEAARAGEEGRGFAVVAMEVRQLAEQSRQATARINDILNEIQQATNSAVMVTEEGSKGAERGMELVTHAGEAIRDLATTLAEVTQAAVQIAASTHQQTNGMDQLAAAMQQIKQASTQSAASSRQTEQSMRDLNHMARQLEEAAANYDGHSQKAIR